jgi:hypothetical protein
MRARFIAAVYILACTGVSWAIILAVAGPDYAGYERTIDTLRAYKPDSACGTGGLAKRYRMPRSERLGRELDSELLSEGWRKSDEGTTIVYRKSYMSVLRFDGMVRVRRKDRNEPHLMHIYISFH